jgi:putative transposase
MYHFSKNVRLAHFPVKNIVAIPDRWSLQRSIGKKTLSDKAQLKLEWIIFYHTYAKQNATDTAKHFAITRKTCHKWLKRYDERNLLTLEEESRVPVNTRRREIGMLQEERIKKLRRKHIRWGKMKLQRIYLKVYGEYVSSWKIQKVIEKNNIYFDKSIIRKQRNKAKQAQKNPKKRITQFIKKDAINHLWHVDTIVFTLTEGGYRYLLTAIDEVSKLAYARLYPSHSSKMTEDFLMRLNYLTEGNIVNLHHDNGSEFERHFKAACKKLNIPQWYSRPHTPKDNPVLERFNRTIQEEFVQMIDIGLEDIKEFNERLLSWLIEYNSIRPHAALDYLTPLEYIELHPQNKVSPMSPSCTKP